jgi:hypothetical protein
MNITPEVERALRGVQAGLSVYMGEVFYGKPEHFETLANQMTAAKLALKPSNDWQDEDVAIMLVLGYAIGCRFDRSPDHAAKLAAALLELAENDLGRKELHKAMAAISGQEYEEG